jgi:Domain of unknown function (DUF5615)
MSRIRLYVDEDAMRHSLLRGLREHDIDSLTVFEAGLIEASDEENLRFATAQGRVLYSFNQRDYCRIHRRWLAQNRAHSGGNPRHSAALFSKRRATAPQTVG